MTSPLTRAILLPDRGSSQSMESMKLALSDLIRSQIRKNKHLILSEARHAEGFMRLLMKQRNSGEKWTKEEKSQLKGYIRHMVGYVPVLCIFLLPGGFFLIPILAEVMDRRKRIRGPGEASLVEPTRDLAAGKLGAERCHD